VLGLLALLSLWLRLEPVSLELVLEPVSLALLGLRLSLSLEPEPVLLELGSLGSSRLRRWAWGFLCPAPLTLGGLLSLELGLGLELNELQEHPAP